MNFEPRSAFASISGNGLLRAVRSCAEPGTNVGNAQIGVQA
ncbi:hypothetical protein [Nocardia amamiensis]|nr:hypothetical protein [Nocardia amamiensis]